MRDLVERVREADRRCGLTRSEARVDEGARQAHLRALDAASVARGVLAEALLASPEWLDAHERLEIVEQERDDARAALELLRNVHLRGCDCAVDDACAFARERDELRGYKALHEQSLGLLRECVPLASNAFGHDALLARIQAHLKEG